MHHGQECEIMTYREVKKLPSLRLWLNANVTHNVLVHH